MTRSKRGLKRRSLYWVVGFLAFAAVLYLFSASLLTALGLWLIREDPQVSSEAVVVLNTGVEYYPRLLEAAALFKKGRAKWVVINGNRKTDVLRELEGKGFERCCPWYEDSLRILSLNGVPRDRVIPLSVEDAYDTISEARAVGDELVRRGMKRIVITTSKFHTRRAGFVWRRMHEGRLSVGAVAATKDPFDSSAWWRDGRQVRWVLAEYGAWIYLWWKSWRGDLRGEGAA